MRLLLIIAIVLISSAAALGCTLDPLCTGNLHAVAQPGVAPPTSNGCGPSGKFGELIPEYKFHSCCDAHDLCYGTCGSDKSTCDLNFLSCNKSKCRFWVLPCKALAETYYAAVKEFGCGPFENAQKERCTCQ